MQSLGIRPQIFRASNILSWSILVFSGVLVSSLLDLGVLDCSCSYNNFVNKCPCVCVCGGGVNKNQEHYLDKTSKDLLLQFLSSTPGWYCLLKPQPVQELPRLLLLFRNTYFDSKYQNREFLYIKARSSKDFFLLFLQFLIFFTQNQKFPGVTSVRNESS